MKTRQSSYNRSIHLFMNLSDILLKQSNNVNMDERSRFSIDTKKNATNLSNS